MNFRWRRRLSSIQLILGDTRRAPGPSERARKKAVREHNTLNQRIDVLEANADIRALGGQWSRQPPA